MQLHGNSVATSWVFLLSQHPEWIVETGNGQRRFWPGGYFNELACSVGILLSDQATPEMLEWATQALPVIRSFAAPALGTFTLDTLALMAKAGELPRETIDGAVERLAQGQGIPLKEQLDFTARSERALISLDELGKRSGHTGTQGVDVVRQAIKWTQLHKWDCRRVFGQIPTDSHKHAKQVIRTVCNALP